MDNKPIPETDIVNNVRLSRCFFYVSDILRQVIENGGTVTVKASKQKKKEFELTEVQRGCLKASDFSISVSEITKYLNTFIDEETTKKLSAATVNNWLLELGLLNVIKLSNGKQRKLPTAQGNNTGIYTEERVGQYGKYTIVLFSKNAQQFIYDNIEAIIKSKYSDEVTDS